MIEYAGETKFQLSFKADIGSQQQISFLGINNFVCAWRTRSNPTGRYSIRETLHRSVKRVRTGVDRNPGPQATNRMKLVNLG